jgi:uncharacterized membrane protein YdbT with pleckstrin-like domain/CRP-like cAMP-binding protein
MSSKAKFLGTLPIFKDLYEDQLEAIAEIAPEYEFSTGAIVAFQRDPAHSLFIVREGRLFASTVDAQGLVRATRAYEAGSCFDDVWLLDTRVHTATIKATAPGRLMTIDGSAFLRLLADYPDIIDALEPDYDVNGNHIGGLSEEAWGLLEKSRVAETDREYRSAALAPDEIVEYWTRRSRWLLVLRVGFRVFMLLAWVVGYLVLSTFISAFLNPWFAAIFLFIPSFLLAFLILYEFLDWRNDYLIITNKQVLHYEFDLNLRRFGTRVHKTPFDQIQSVSTSQPNLISKLLGLGTARITSAAATGGTIVFDYISEPRRVEEAISRLQRRVREIDVGQQQTLMRQTLTSHFNIDTQYKPAQAEESGETEEPGINLFGWFGWLVSPFATRVEVAGEVTYRKSRIFLLIQLRWAFLVAALLALGGVILLRTQASSIWWLIWGVVAIIDVIMFVWYVEDWRNDQYRVNDRYVLDIDRKPFGFGESRRQAELENIQNVSSIQPGLIANIFRYGNVSIETAGAAADILFERVAHPDLVQQDIFRRRESLRKKKREAESAQRRSEYAMLLDVYQQITEQGQVPRRTPTVNLDEE